MRLTHHFRSTTTTKITKQKVSVEEELNQSSFLYPHIHQQQLPHRFFPFFQPKHGS